MNNFLNLILFISLIFFKITPVYAGGASTTVDTTKVTGVIDVVANIFNVVIWVVGIVLVIMLAYGAIKSGMSLGDPRSLEGAKQTWTYALYGFMVVVLVAVIFNIITGIFGISSLGFGGLLDNLSGAITSFLESTGWRGN